LGESLVYFTKVIERPPAIHTNPPKNTALRPNYPAPTTKNGAAIFPKFDIAYDIPVPVDLI